MPMNNRLLRPRASGVHPEAAAWATRVTANGGSVSGSTLSAVSRFCTSIDATAGLRAAVLRLNLFCGNNLNACLVPLYRGASLLGTQLGNTTDTNVNFVSGDFQETGSGGGLKGNGTSKYLNTGVSPSNVPSLSNVHLSFSGTSLEASGSDRAAIGSWNGGGSPGSDIYNLDIFAAYVSGRAVRLSNYNPGNFSVIASPASSEGHLIGTRTSTTLATTYRDGASAATSTFSSNPVSHTRPFFVFAFNSAGTPSAFTAASIRMYSIGNGLTAAQAHAFSQAVTAFNTALGRA